jgi:hypothetical protein
LGPLNLQPSELVKLFAVIYVAGYLVRHADDVVNRISGFIRPMILIGIAGALILQQPDFGTTAVMLATVMGLLFLGGVSLMPFVLLFLVVGAGLTLLILISPYRLQRVTSFLDPFQDPFNTGYQLSQALIAFGRGEWFGVGLGNGIQKQFFLPEAHTDFLASVVGEELGLVGMLVLIAAFAFLTWRAFSIGARAEAAGKRFAAYAAQGNRPRPRLAGLRQYRRECRDVADEGPDAAVVELREQQSHCCMHGDRHPLEDRCHGSPDRSGARTESGAAVGPSIAVMAGGTGGHVFPALAVAERLREQGMAVFWIGTRRGMESRLVPEHGFEMEWIRIEGLRGKGLAQISRGALEDRRRPLAGLADPASAPPVGGSGDGRLRVRPRGLAARVLGLPLVIHEQNFVPGMTNQWLARIATRVFEAFPASFPAARRAEACGNPVRQGIIDLPAPGERLLRRSAEADSDVPRLLVLGGSLGAQVLNEMVPHAVAALPAELRPRVRPSGR